MSPGFDITETAYYDSISSYTCFSSTNCFIDEKRLFNWYGDLIVSLRAFINCNTKKFIPNKIPSTLKLNHKFIQFQRKV